MSRKRYRRGPTDTQGRSQGDGHHARVHRWLHRSPAFQHLTVGARALLLELMMLHNGQNNGELFLAVREAAKRLNIGKTHAAKCFADLEAHGFIRPKKVGDYKRSDAFNIKSGAGRRGEATKWILTEYPIGDAMGPGSRDFMSWQPSAKMLAAEAEKRLRRSAWRAKCPSRRTVALKLVESVRGEGHLPPQNQVCRSATGHTDSIPGGRAQP